MNYYISNGTFYASMPKSNELYHYGVKGMKWGHRKRIDPIGSIGRRASGTYQNMNNARAARQQTRQAQRQAKQAARNTPEAKAARAEKAKKAAKIGAAVVGTALAAYGTYKLAKYVQGKRSQAAMQKANDYINKNVYRKWGDTKFKDGTRMMDFRDGMGNELVTRGSRGDVGKYVGQHNAKVVATGRQMYKDATNTKLDRGLAKVVNAGDATKAAAKRAATSTKTAVKNTATKAKNTVLDVVNPIYEYTPGSTSSKTRDLGNGIKYTETVTNYVKRKKKR